MPCLASPGVDYGDVFLPIMARPGDTEACFNIMIEDDVLVEESQECFMATFAAEKIVNLEIGNVFSICCIVDDDSKCMIRKSLSYQIQFFSICPRCDYWLRSCRVFNC